MREFARPHHRLVARILQSLDGDLLEHCRCYFGGGTQIALQLDEYRESRDIDFLCSQREGFRVLREGITSDSLGPICARRIALAREVRADRDGIRTFLAVDQVAIKFEIVLEARVDLDGARDSSLGVPVLSVDCVVAEKFLANADRGLDDSTKSRDAIDLAFLAARFGWERLLPGLRLAETAYGAAVRRLLHEALELFARDRNRLSDCAAALGIADRATLRAGLLALRRLTAS